MDATTLEIANKLNNKIKEFNEILNCFGWQPFLDEDRADIRLATNPQLIIEFDDVDGRDQKKIPMKLNEIFIDLIRTEIKKGIDESITQFNAL